MCDFRRGAIECRGNGYLWDADRDGYDPANHSLPCPQCNTEEYLLDAKEDAENTVFSVSAVPGCRVERTGESKWLEAVRLAESVAPDAASAALAKIAVVEALRPGSGPDGEQVVRYAYQ
ncbi:TPA: hypothetical protein QDA91_003117 [Burkholderia vietnamiensis]|nr:hypothetical protein [Burkholderia vietnamiensis]